MESKSPRLAGSSVAFRDDIYADSYSGSLNLSTASHLSHKITLDLLAHIVQPLAKKSKRIHLLECILQFAPFIKPRSRFTPERFEFIVAALIAEELIPDLGHPRLRNPKIFGNKLIGPWWLVPCVEIV